MNEGGDILHTLGNPRDYCIGHALADLATNAWEYGSAAADWCSMMVSVTGSPDDVSDSWNLGNSLCFLTIGFLLARK